MRKLMLAVCAVTAGFALAAPKAKTGSMADRLRANNRGYSREIRTDYDTIPGKVIHWYADGHAKTNTPFTVNCHVVTNAWELTLINEKKVANYVRKAAKDAENAEKHDQKNYENWLKDTEKAMRKSSEAMLPFYEDIIFFATNRIKKVEGK